MALGYPCGRCSPWGLWLKLCRLYNTTIQRFFARFGELVACYPLLTMLVCFVIMASLASGFAFMKTENRTEKLYIPQNSESIKDLNKATDYGFHRPSRSAEVIILNNQDTNVLTKDCLSMALQLHKLITNISGYTNLCLPNIKGDKPVVSEQCKTEEPLVIFNYSSKDFENPLAKLNDPQLSNNNKIQRVLGTITRNSSSHITSSKAIRLIYYLKGARLDEDISKETTDWEKEFLDRMKVYDSGNFKCGPIFYTAERSMDDSIGESAGSDVKLISITFAVMINFACFMLGKYRNPLMGHGLLALGGVFSVGIGILAAFGLSMHIKTPFVSIVGILPFLIIGVGIDDMFIIVDELDRTHPDQTIPQRIGFVMRNVGPAITMTTMTDLLAFAVGTSSKFPSIVYFCTYAALAISFAFCFLVTVFVAFMSFDCKRMNSGRRDMIPCVKAAPHPLGQRWDEPLPQTSNKLMELWGKLLMKTPTKLVVAILSACLLGVGIYGTTFINEEFDRRALAKDGSEFIKFLDTLEAYFTDDIPVNLILESEVNYSVPSTIEQIRNLTQIVTNNKYYRPYVVSWLDAFQNWSSNVNKSKNYTSFEASVQQFLESNPRFMQDVLFSPDNTAIKASRLYCFIKETTSSVTLREAMTTLRSDLSEKSRLPVFASEYTFIFIEQFVSTLPETIRNLALAAAAILVVTSLFLVNPVVVMLVLLGFAALIFELLGLMHVWGVSLNSISMINLVMAIGFAVDYSAHVAHAFVFSHEKSPEKKVIDALRTVGASVFMGGFSTFLGMVVTGFASSEIFRIFFKMFFGIVVLGLLHGLCFLPVWLSIFCRHHINIGVEENGNPNPKTSSAVDNLGSSSSSENHENSKCNPVMNPTELLAGPATQTDSKELPWASTAGKMLPLSVGHLTSNEESKIADKHETSLEESSDLEKVAEKEETKM